MDRCRSCPICMARFASEKVAWAELQSKSLPTISMTKYATIPARAASSTRSQHYETKLCRPRDRLGPAVGIELGENGGDVELHGVEGDVQPARDRFVGGAIRHGGKHFKLAGSQPR